MVHAVSGTVAAIAMPTMVTTMEEMDTIMKKEDTEGEAGKEVICLIIAIIIIIIIMVVVVVVVVQVEIGEG